MTDEIRWFVGIDWASESHQIYLLDARGQCLGERSVPHGGAGLGELCDWLTTKTGAPPAAIAVAIEVPHGPVVEVLLERGFQVYAINPKQLDRFRDRFSVAGAVNGHRSFPDCGPLKFPRLAADMATVVSHIGDRSAALRAGGRVVLAVGR